MTTTGTATLTTKFSMYAVSSSDAVPWPMTIPARSECSATAWSQASANAFQSGKSMAGLGMAR